MTLPDFKIYIRFDDGGTWEYYYVDPNGDVDYTSVPTELNQAPEGWKDIKLSH